MASATQARYRARVAPRTAPRRGSRIHWDRVGRVALVILLFGILISYVGPTLHVFESWRESKSGAEQLSTLKAENEALEAQASSLKEPSAAIAEARKLGLLSPEERGYVIRGLP